MISRELFNGEWIKIWVKCVHPINLRETFLKELCLLHKAIFKCSSPMSVTCSHLFEESVLKLIELIYLPRLRERWSKDLRHSMAFFNLFTPSSEIFVKLIFPYFICPLNLRHTIQSLKREIAIESASEGFFSNIQAHHQSLFHI